MAALHTLMSCCAVGPNGWSFENQVSTMDQLLDDLMAWRVLVTADEAAPLRTQMLKEREYLQNTLANPGTTWMARAVMAYCGGTAASVIQKIDTYYATTPLEARQRRRRGSLPQVQVQNEKW